MHQLRRLSWGLAVLLACALGRAQDAEELELDHTLSMGFETPHTKWAKPYAGGTLRVLLFCNGRGTVPREGVELMQRFDMKIDAVFWRRIVDTTREGWHGGDLGLQRMLRLAEKPYDCYVFLGMRPSQLTSEMQFKVLKPIVEGGAGIVCVGSDDKRVLKPSHKLAEPPAFVARARPLGAYKAGKGRGVLLPGVPDIPYALGWDTEYDYWQERFGRAILWAAGRASEVELPAVGVGNGEFQRLDLPQKAVGVAWKNPAESRLTLELSLRRHDGVVLALEPEKTREAEGKLTRELPRLRAGRYHLDVTARGRKGVAAWATVPFEIRSERRVETVTLDPAWGEIGERIRGAVKLVGAARAEEQLAVRLRDRRGRILMEKRTPAGQGGAFEFPIESWMPMLVLVEAAIVDGEAEAASGHAYFNVVKRHRGQFNYLIWDVPKGPTAPYGEESLARLGTTLQLGGGAPRRVLAAYDIAWVPYTTRILEKHDKSGIMRPSCWNDHAKVLLSIQERADKYRPARQHGVFVYSLGDENHVRGSCISPHCLKAYRAYLKTIYGTVAKLNASWGSKYKSFDVVQLLKPDDNQANEAKRLKNYPRWFDRQAFRSFNYVEYCKQFARAYRAIDSRSRTGFEGAGRFGSGDDIDLFVRECEFWSPYPGTADEVLRSIAPRDFPRSNWMGYRKDATSLIAKYWRMVTRGCDSVWWWRWDCIGRFHGFLAPHLGPWPATRELVDETAIVRNGLGTLLIRSEMLDGGVAMLFSHPSLYANKIEGSTHYGSVEQSHAAWHRAIRELGLQFRYVADRQLRLGEFDAKRYKVLVLSQCEAIGPKEAAVIEAFANGGGTVIADVRPGLYDDRCKPLKAGALDKLFGIRRTGTGEPEKGQATLKLDGAEVAIEKALCDPGVALAGGKAAGACGKLPLLIVNQVGKGRAVLLNFAIASYPALAQADAPEAAADLLAALFAQAGVTPAVRTLTKGRRTRNLETVRWRNGEIEIVALFRHTGDDERVRVELAEPRWVYDLRCGHALRQRRSFGTKVLGSRPTFLVLTPKRLPRVSMELDKGNVAPGEQPRLRLAVPDASGLHAVRIRAETPDGEPAEWLHQVVIVGAEPKEVALPIALNDPKGKWTIRAIDLFTERAERLTLTVK